MACNESILAILRDNASHTLECFINSESDATERIDLMMKLERELPVFGLAVRRLSFDKGKLADDWLHGVGHWFLNRRRWVVSNVSSYEPDPMIDGLEDNWEEVQFFLAHFGIYTYDLVKTAARYFVPPIRMRPNYPRLDNAAGTSQKRDGKRKTPRDDDGCNKHFADYPERGLTGGCQVLCCTHQFFYGFHFFDTFEGRNDMFSAMYTRYSQCICILHAKLALTLCLRFPVAPEVVIHDFACSLADYCLSREPMYFKNTLFVVDKFHSRNHKACTQSSKMETYMADPMVSELNSNAAEHLNSGLRHLRTSMSGMREDRSILFMNTYVCVRNRLLLYKRENPTKRVRL
jgi:hypothetical protein